MEIHLVSKDLELWNMKGENEHTHTHTGDSIAEYQ